ncbi:MAG: hypothetical protein GY906_24770 [bacterium]|nr:hypothetical protein [bacterium]
MNLILLTLMQASLGVSSMQVYVDIATRELNLPPSTVIERGVGPDFAWTNGRDVFVHTLLFQDGVPPEGVLEFIAYHEVCHIARWANSAERNDEVGTDVCAILNIKERTRRRHTRVFDKWFRYHKFPRKKE